MVKAQDRAKLRSASIRQAEELNGLALRLYEAKNYDEARRVAISGLEVSSNHFGLLGNHAAACGRLDLHQEALNSCLKQLAIDQSDARVWMNAGNALRAMGNLIESEQCLRKAVRVGGYEGAVHYNLAMTLLLAGNLAEGFEEFERRFESALLTDFRRSFSVPLWDGAPLDGQRILLWTEQGSGDTIQFTRYAPYVSERGGQVLLETPRPLARLMKSMVSGVEFVDKGDPVHFDLHCPLLSLTHKCGIIPPPPAVSVPHEIATAWRQRIDGIASYQNGVRKIGLVWAGSPIHSNDRNRSISLDAFAPLLGLRNCAWFSLQVGAASTQLAQLNYPIYDLAPFCSDYIETAAAIEQLDLVISVDTSVAHLAGTVGKTVWVMIPFSPDWRWMLKPTDTPWYPTMRLFRQPVPGDWATVIADIVSTLDRAHN